MRPSAAAVGAAGAARLQLAREPAAQLRVVRPRPLRIADVALFYGERSGGIRTYLEAKARHAARTGCFEHHLLVPGRRERHLGARHELPSLRLAAANGYRLPLGASRLKTTLRALAPDVVLLHDPFWAPLGVTRVAHELGARVIAVHHGSAALGGAGMPGPRWIYRPLLRGWIRAAYAPVDAIMAATDPSYDAGRPATMALRLGLPAVFAPQPAVVRGEHVLYVGRLAREKGVLACGARVVACAGAPAATTCGALATAFAPGDHAGLLAAIETARRLPQDLDAAATLSAANRWDALFAAELADVEALVR